jgi:serine/threonine protein kinase
VKLAVKVVNDSSEETINEIEILKRLRHDNIVSFFGSMPDPNSSKLQLH